MSKKDSLLIPRRGFLRSSAIGIAVSGIPNSNADNYSEEINMDAKKKEVVFSKPFYPTNDMNKDFEFLKKFYDGVVGIVAENS